MKNPFNHSNDVRLDDQLADFTDEVLRLGGPPQALTHPDLEGAENTVLRLRSTFPRYQPSPTAVARMESRISAHARDALRRAGPKWRSRQSHRRLIFAFAASLAAVSLLIILPGLSKSMESGTAAAVHPTYVGLAVAAVGGIVLLALWLSGRK